ncbi:FAD-binding oxidoreductase [Uliginosibacterium sp. sgz301328]|uniref:FAD-binding oxidoreductase n=1 Tax=Uliginosibacterium sp. sgz301328 TaxID=3243764 RepID=UPI00359E16AF
MPLRAPEAFFTRLANAGIPIDADPDRLARATQNITTREQPLAGRVTPRTVDEVRAVVLAAFDTNVPLYPVSTGLNWGYGSRSPATAGCVLVDLSAMRAIRNADDIGPDNPVAIIEPGVTQGQLADYLAEHVPSVYFNVTGSARETSVLGASLDRGVGYFGPRRDDVFGLEIVTGTAELLYTGLRRLGEDSPIATCHPYGLGPQLDGLFFQGNYGIVTSACLRLRPRQACHVAVSIGIPREDDLPGVIDTLAHLKRGGALPAVTHIGNRARTHATLHESVVRFLVDECGVAPGNAPAEADDVLRRVAPHPWTGLAGIAGTRAQVRAAIRAIRAALGRRAQLRVVTDRLLDTAISLRGVLGRIGPLRPLVAAAVATKPLHGLATGVPSSIAVRNLMLKFGSAADAPVGELDTSRCGLMYICPVLPLRGMASVGALHRLQGVAERFGHTLYTTLNIETDLTLVAVINLLFDRGDAADTARAQECADALLADIEAQGLSVYRARADMMSYIAADTRGHSQAFWQHVADLKRVFDPRDIIAPGRYNRVLREDRP